MKIETDKLTKTLLAVAALAVATIAIAVIVAANSPTSYKAEPSNKCQPVGRYYEGKTGPYIKGQPYCADTPFSNGRPHYDPRAY